MDETGKPVHNASVRSGTAVTNTDINGTFRFTNIQLSRNAGFVLAEKAGYFNGSRTIFTHASTVNNVEIWLIPKTNRGNFSASSGGTVTIQGGHVNFPANSIVNSATNAAYSGTVNVSGAYLDPADPNLPFIMPGNLTGLTAGNEQRLLRTFGMIVVELEGAGGEKLNITGGKTATLTMPIPASLQAAAPAIIPLWHFDEAKGLWIEEGTAARQGNNYVGTVAHFSFWNCDVPSNFVNLKLTLKNQNGQPLVNYRVELINTQGNYSSAGGFTDSSGVVSGGIPVGTALQMKVYNRCNTVVHTQNIGPYSSSTDAGTITVTTQPGADVTISGSVSDCSLAPVTNGFVDLVLEGVHYRAAVSSGNFAITIIRCSNTPAVVQLVATDMATGQQGNVISAPITSGNVPVGNLNACGTAISQFATFVVNGGTTSYVQPADSLVAFRNGNATSVYLSGISSANQDASFTFTGDAAPGVYPVTGLSITRGNTRYTQEGTISVSISEYGITGQFIAGNFSGNVKDNMTNAVVPVTGNFRIKRY